MPSSEDILQPSGYPGRYRLLRVLCQARDYVEELARDLAQPMQEDDQVSGKDVIVMYDTADDSFFGEIQPLHLYASGDTVWIVGAQEPLLTEAFEKLP